MRGAISRRVFLKSSCHAVAAGTGLGIAEQAQRAASQGRRSSLTALTTELARHLPSWLGEARVPGLSLVLVDDGVVSWNQQFGVKDAVTGAAVDAATMFEAASMSKPVFAYVVMKLHESGVLDLDAPLVKYTTRRFLAGDPRLDAMTARHVLSHTGGFQNWRSDANPLRIHFTPGARYMYSGEGYNYLQSVVTELLGQPFERYMRDRLFVPLGMTSSQYVWNDEAARRMARPHDADGKPFDNQRSTAEAVARYGAAGAMLTTPADYARFVISVIDPQPADAHRVNGETIAEMLRPRVAVEAGQFASSWALGWQLFHQPGRDFLYHGGNNRGFHCAAVASVAGKSGFVAMTNGEQGPIVLQRLLAADAMQRFLNGR
jgi:CubicO group peptidase (beta-lactamase class C family)